MEENSDIPDFTNDDSYRRATDFALPDDNFTARGTAKSYRKTPYHSRVAGLDYQDTNEIEYLVDGPRDEHRLPLPELLGRLNTDVQTGLTHPQVSGYLQMYGPNDIGASIHVPEWVRFSKMIFGGSSLLIWTGIILCFVSSSIQAGLVRI